MSSLSPLPNLPIVVIGAGVSGLVTAQHLKKAGYRVVVVEASPIPGGRMINSSLVPTLEANGCYAGSFRGIDVKTHEPVDLGAELIHGDGTELYRFIASNDWKVRHVVTWAQGDGSPSPVGDAESFYWLGGEKRLISSLNVSDKDVQRVNDLLFNLYKLDDKEADLRSVEEYLVSKGVAAGSQALKLAEAGYANTYCSSIKTINLRDTATCERGFNGEGEGEFRMAEEGYCLSSRVISKLIDGIDVHFSWPVAQVNRPNPNGPIQLFSKNGQQLLASRVVVSVPPTVFNEIRYEPPLPLSKQIAASSIKMESAMKLILFFRKRFWSEKIHGIVCADTPVPEIWFDNNVKPPGILMEAKSQNHLIDHDKKPERPLYRIVGFVCTHFADRLRALPEAEALEMFKDQINDIFGTTAEPNPAHIYLEGTAVFCWNDVPYIRGGYTNPSIPERTRHTLAAPVDNRLFFCGEATNYPTFTAAHCAMDSGNRAAKQVLASFEKQPEAKL